MNLRQNTRRRTTGFATVLAVLAGGLALGVASAWTVAAWQDPEAATTSFTAGTFDTQSQGASGEWASHEPGSPALLSADLTGLAPGGSYDAPAAGDSQYVWLNVRTGESSTRGGSVQLGSFTADGALADALEYRVVTRVASESECTAADFTADAIYLVGGPDLFASTSAPAPTGATVGIGAHAQNAAGVCAEIRVAAPAHGDTGALTQRTTSHISLTVTVTQN
ncbi:SipW-dependent-type signal peptide-containing protein [Microbacterium sp. G2-8]|uniref:SipW-dependent-type signal peptide-containing protein n=1 Tax=Microbacterium sp. G2-8 TaxID=2842454 RepID=UPI001C8ACDAD|nr:SipW-dependent-type signal peptide-containing protein [Microbacterium sp. G2-8]